MTTTAHHSKQHHPVSLCNPRNPSHLCLLTSISRNIVDEEPDNYGVKQADADIGANMEAHDKALKSRVDDGSESATRKGSKKDAPALDGRSKVGEEGDAHDLAQSRQP